MLFLIGCTLPQNPDPTTAPPIIPPADTIQAPIESALPTAQPPTATATTVVEGWQLLQPGLEQRRYELDNAEFLAVRVDPNLFTFRAHYRAGDALRLNTWADELPSAHIIINANFFDPQNETLGLLISDGQAFGSAYRDRGGMFYVQNGIPRIRSNTAEPYYGGEVIEQAVQAFPMLVLDGVQTYTNNSRVARRTAIGQDAQGRIILLVTARGSISLAGLSAFLATSDMNLTRAFNLDGGGSTMMAVNTPDVSFQVNTFDAVPVVLAVYPR